MTIRFTNDNTRLRVPHPIPYQGSKRQLASLILSYFPAHVSRLVEPFAGSAAISLAAAFRNLADSVLINDAHLPIIELWRAIIDEPELIVAKYRSLWEAQLGREREFYDIVRAKFNRSREPEFFLYLLARCVKAAVRYNASGEFNNSPDNRRKGARWEVMRERILGASALLKGRTETSALDYRLVLTKCEPSDFIYLDPPYQGVSTARDNRYCPTVNHNEFCDSLAELNKMACKYIVSYDGRLGEKVYGKAMPKSLNLTRIEVHAGRSSQATLLGRNDDTFESLYLSPALASVISAP